ncbi:MAG: excinuclease ABC subunit UvrC [Dehalococcoidales bacterium]|nr:MAG: excinuclease ABC subunit UvrC [Dehalococcoidales bacterium]
MNTATDLVREQLQQLPQSPGIYIFKDPSGKIIYVGKAASLENRVKSYFYNQAQHTPKTRRLVRNVADLEFYVTNTEEEALILEYNFIQRHQPFYNIRLKDGKSYPYLKISLNEEWPRVFLTRQVQEDGGRYFGPFSSAKSLRQTIKVLRSIFPLRSCTKPINGTRQRPCLNYHIHLCPGPCVGAITRQEYMEIIKQVILFLEGKQEQVVRRLESRMRKASEALDFETAGSFRDQVQSINRIIENQSLAAKVKGEQDVIAFVTERDRAFVQVFFIRGSKLIGRESFTLQGVDSEEPEQIMTGFIKQFYGSASYIPPLLLLQHKVEDKEIIEEWLQGKRGSSVRIQVPSRGNKKQLVDIVARNANQGLVQMKLKRQITSTDINKGLSEIKKELSLPKKPVRMECYDISNIQGKAAVGSMVVFEDGKPKSSDYRRFRIQTVPGADDYAMLREVLRRRLKRFKNNGDSKPDKNWDKIPDLMLIDGGKGQLNAVLEVMKETGAEFIPLASIAKQNEEIFLPGKTKPVVLQPDSYGLQMLQRLRDEAHRFAITYHKNLRNKQTVKSALDNITGIGPKRKRALMRHFGSVRAIREASVEELTVVPGITQLLAQQIKELL